MKFKEFESNMKCMDSSKSQWINVLSVPNICSHIKGHNVKQKLMSHNFVKGTKLVDKKLSPEIEIYILIRSDLYSDFLTQETQTSSSRNLVAIKSMIEWFVSCPVVCKN